MQTVSSPLPNIVQDRLRDRVRGLGNLSALPDDLLSSEVFPHINDIDAFISFSAVSPYAAELSHQAAERSLHLKCRVRSERLSAYRLNKPYPVGISLDEAFARSVYFKSAEKYFDRRERIACRKVLERFDEYSQPQNRFLVAARAVTRWPRCAFFVNEAYFTSSILGLPEISIMNHAVELGALDADRILPDLFGIDDLIARDKLPNADTFVQQYGRNIIAMTAWQPEDERATFKLEALNQILVDGFALFDINGLCFNPKAVNLFSNFADSIEPTKNAWLLRALLELTVHWPSLERVEALMQELVLMRRPENQLPLLMLWHEQLTQPASGAELLIAVLQRSGFSNHAAFAEQLLEPDHPANE